MVASHPPHFIAGALVGGPAPAQPISALAARASLTFRETFYKLSEGSLSAHSASFRGRRGETVPRA
eukprot:scaffold121108_cov28-Tisochrysis_lutea.AAC.6